MSAPGEDVPQGTSSSNQATPQLDDEISGLSEGAASQPLIMPTSTLSGIASGGSRTSFTTAMESHRVSFYQADGPTIADQPTTVSEQIQSLEPPSSSTASADPPRVEPNSTSRQSSLSPTSEFSLNDILDDNTTFTAQTPAPPGDMYLTPRDYLSIVRGQNIGHPIRSTYRIGDSVTLERTDPDSRPRLHLPLPNPRNLATLEMVMTVPYELGREPVRLVVAMPPGNSPYVSDSRQVFQFTVTQEADHDENVPAPGP